MIGVDEVLFFISDEKYTRVQTASYEALIRKPVRDLAEELDPALFWQIHRSTIVNVERIREFLPWFQGDWMVVLADGTRLQSGRSYRDRIRALMDG